MKYSQSDVVVQFVLTSCLLSCIANSSLAENITALSDNDIVTATGISTNRCGGVIRDDEATISYKVSEQVLPNERCVWIIASPNASAYEVEVTFTSPPEDRLLVVGGISHLRSEWISNLYPKSGETAVVNANVLIITFHTSNNPGNTVGFLLSSRKVDANAIVSESSRYELFERKNDAEPSIVGHPANVGLYSNNELSLLIFPPQDNIFRNENRVLTYKAVGLDSCNDRLHVHLFNSVAARWDWDIEICGVADYVKISGDDVILLAFHSDSARVDRGFFLVETTLKSQCPG